MKIGFPKILGRGLMISILAFSFLGTVVYTDDATASGDKGNGNGNGNGGDRGDGGNGNGNGGDRGDGGNGNGNGGDRGDGGNGNGNGGGKDDSGNGGGRDDDDDDNGGAKSDQNRGRTSNSKTANNTEAARERAAHYSNIVHATSTDADFGIGQESYEKWLSNLLKE